MMAGHHQHALSSGSGRSYPFQAVVIHILGLALIVVGGLS
jgi:hypothetical protein